MRFVPLIPALALFVTRPAFACMNDLHEGQSDWTELGLISVLVVAGGGLSLVLLAGAVGLPVTLLLRKRPADGAVRGAAGNASDDDGPPDVWVPGS